MSILLWLPAIALAASPIALWWGINGGQFAREAEMRASASYGGGVPASAVDTIEDVSQRGGGVFGESIDLEILLARAGLTGRVDPRQIATIRLLSTVVGIVVAAAILATGLSTIRILGAVAAGLCGLSLPKIWLNRRAGARSIQIRNSLPDALDQLTILSRAGLGLQPALARTSEALRGPLSEEFGRMIQDLEIGLSRQEALAGLVERTGAPDVKRLAVALDQAAAMGAPIGGVLSAQADHLRSLRELRAEEAAQKLPVKLSLPLVLCILPTLFLVILGPAMIRISESFGG